MSNIDHNLPIGEIIPAVQAEWVFQNGHEQSRFAIAKIAIGDEILPGFEDAYQGYMQLRGRVYAHKTRMIDESHLNEDGSEKPDNDDSRSVHFVGIENRGYDQRIVAATRHIIQDMFHPEPLPIANFFPGSVPEFDLNTGIRPFEVSRWIQAHEKPAIQAAIAQPLLRSTLIDALAYNRIPSFCTVEESVAAHLVKLRIALTQVAKPRFVPEYDDVNAGYEIDLAETAKNYMVTDEEVHYVRKNPSLIQYFGRVAAYNQANI